jgi:hypothetical protein
MGISTHFEVVLHVNCSNYRQQTACALHKNIKMKSLDRASRLWWPLVSVAATNMRLLTFSQH